MKKVMALIATLLVGCAVFAQNSKALFTGVYDFATQASNTWKQD